jgi:L-threonylcarbamoyladenylate synthase
VRLPDLTFARTLLRAAGPLATTSANLSGMPSATDAQTAGEQLGGRVELLLNGGTTPGGVPSTVVDCTAAEPVVLRPGPISEAQIKAALLEK